MNTTPLQPETGDIAWQPLPPSARTLFMLGGLAWVIPFALIPGVLAMIFDFASPWRYAACGALLGAAFGVWLGAKHYRHTHWRLDGDGFTLRRGRMWRSETRVPQSRVQHLDLKRGPLERRYGLSTLVIHTAGSRHSAVSVAGLDAADAEQLRDQLARQVDEFDDAD
ncbi:MAG TPA: PH domain-containing protein [Luteimonas sp.]|nr:PH domain-containing protein [Luteimonas sp.]